ncbi:MAG TPA: hypothetical protein GX497_10590 [Bacillus bacterium]|nr:hypothetical protein [Bacillus sp. (in: firmicutes)]
MTSIELKKMRVRQIVASNILIVAAIVIYFVLITVLNITYTQLFLALGVILLCQALIGLLKKDSTNSFISIFKQVAIYEKEKMGAEWKKKQKSEVIWRFLLSSIMFFQSYLHSESKDKMAQMDLIYMLFFAIFVIVLVNISLLFHIRKVDRSNTEEDLKGYTLKTNLKAVIIGIVSGVIMFSITIWYIMSTI